MIESSCKERNSKLSTFYLTALAFYFLFFIFLTKLFGFIDVAVLLSFLGALLYFSHSKEIKIPKDIYLISLFFLLLTFYAGSISVLYEMQEVIFFAKFFKTFLLFFFLYILWLLISDKLDYFTFLKVITLSIFIHSLIVIFCIFSPDFRELIYAFTGYQPRGPEWSRSPGLTISFNSTAIVHIAGLWFLISRNLWSVPFRIIFVVTIIFSLVFLGRSMAFLGLALILFLYILDNYKSYKVLLFIVAFVLFSSFFSSRENVELIGNEILLANYDHFIEPLVKFLSEDDSGVQNISNTIGSHYTLSDNVLVVLFGNSMAGHVGLFDQFNSTDSDVGLINSINANGLFVTFILYVFYMFIIWNSRRGDWQTVFIISVMTIVLTFKETGFFTSYATTLLFLVYFYNSTFSRFITKRNAT